MAIQGMPRSSLYQLRQAFENCVKDWGSDPAYDAAKAKISSGLREAEQMRSSPGSRSAFEATHKRSAWPAE